MKKALLIAPKSSVIELFCSANISALKELGFSVCCASNFSDSEHSGAVREKLASEGVGTADFPFERASFIKNRKVIPLLRKYLREERFDIVHCNTETGGFLTYLASGKGDGTKYVYTPHGFSFYKGSSLLSRVVYKNIDRAICRRMAANIAINKEELECMRSWNAKTAFFSHGIGVDTLEIAAAKPDRAAKRRELGIPEDAFLVLSVGELNENKNHETVMRAVAGLEDTGVYYLICGEGKLRGYLTEAAERLGIADRVIMPGFRYDMPEIFRIADVFAFMSVHEGLAVSLMQAMAARLPAVVSEIRGNVDLIEDNRGGFLISEPHDEGECGKKLERLIKDKELRERFGAFNEKKVLEFSRENVRKEIKEIYRSVLERDE